MRTVEGAALVGVVVEWRRGEGEGVEGRKRYVECGMWNASEIKYHNY